MKNHFLAAFVIGLGLMPKADLEAAEGVVVTLSSVGARVRAQNPELAAARLRIDEALGHLRQSGRRPNPELEIGAEHNDHFREGKFELGFSQRFPVTDRLRLETGVSAAQVQVAEAEIRDVERQLVAEARSTLVRILGIREQRRLGRQQAAIFKELAQFVGDASTRGELSSIDAGQAKLEAAGFANRFRQLDAAEAAAVGELKPLLGIGLSETLHVGGSLPPVQVQSTGVDPSRRADWQATRSEVDAAANEVALEQANRYDDIEVGLFAAAERTEDAPAGLETEGVFGLRVKIPLPLWDKNEGNIDAAVARRARKEKELRALGARIHLEAAAAHAEMVEWAKLDSELADTLLPLAEQQAKLAEQAYRDGQGDLQAVLRAREQAVQLASSRVDAQREFHLARIRWLAAAGDGQGPARDTFQNSGERSLNQPPTPSDRHTINCQAMKTFFIPAVLTALISNFHAQESADPDRAANTVILGETAIRNLNLETVTVEEQDFETTVFAIGRIEEIPAHHYSISSRISGRAIEVNVFEGDHVEAGQVLIKVESRQPGDPPPTIPLKALHDGLVIESRVHAGQPVEPDTQLLDISDRSEMWAVAKIPEQAAAGIAPGTRARIRVPAIGGDPIEAKLLRLGVTADRVAGAVEGVFQIANPAERLQPGMRAEFSIVLSTRSEVLAVPRASIQGDPAKRVVYVKDFEIPHAFVRVPVVLGEQNEEYVEVVSGLFAGDDVVTRGSYSLGFVGGGVGMSLKAALDAAHGHEHNEDGSVVTPEQQAAAEASSGEDTHGHGSGNRWSLILLVYAIGMTLVALLLAQLLWNKRKTSA